MNGNSNSFFNDGFYYYYFVTVTYYGNGTLQMDFTTSEMIADRRTRFRLLDWWGNQFYTYF